TAVQAFVAAYQGSMTPALQDFLTLFAKSETAPTDAIARKELLANLLAHKDSFSQREWLMIGAAFAEACKRDGAQGLIVNPVIEMQVGIESALEAIPEALLLSRPIVLVAPDGKLSELEAAFNRMR